MNSISLMNLDRFDGYPDSGDRKLRPLTVLEKWQELGYDPADVDQVNTPASRDDLKAPLLLSPPAGDLKSEAFQEAPKPNHPLSPE